MSQQTIQLTPQEMQAVQNRQRVQAQQAQRAAMTPLQKAATALVTADAVRKQKQKETEAANTQHETAVKAWNESLGKLDDVGKGIVVNNALWRIDTAGGVPTVTKVDEGHIIDLGPPMEAAK